MENSIWGEEGTETYYWIEMQVASKTDWKLMGSTEKPQELAGGLARLKQEHPDATDWRVTREVRTTRSEISIYEISLPTE